jgi:hypothetical protein
MKASKIAILSSPDRSVSGYKDVDMKLRYFVVDEQGMLCKVRKSSVQQLWEGSATTEELGFKEPSELKLVSVVCDQKLIPQKVYLLRLPLTAGKFTEENYLTLQIFTMPDCVTPQEVARHHGGGWPSDLLRQLAIAADVPLCQLQVPVRIGGPLLLAAALKVTPTEALRYLK